MTANNNGVRTLYMALELGCDKWVLASATQAAEKPRFRTVGARNLAALQEEITKAKARFGLPMEAPVCTALDRVRLILAACAHPSSSEDAAPDDHLRTRR